jgi:hypothetical protein
LAELVWQSSLGGEFRLCHIGRALAKKWQSSGHFGRHATKPAVHLLKNLLVYGIQRQTLVFHFPTEHYATLSENNVMTVGDLLQKTYTDLRRGGLSKAVAESVEKLLDWMGLRLAFDPGYHFRKQWAARQQWRIYEDPWPVITRTVDRGGPPSITVSLHYARRLIAKARISLEGVALHVWSYETFGFYQEQAAPLLGFLFMQSGAKRIVFHFPTEGYEEFQRYPLSHSLNLLGVAGTKADPRLATAA